MIGFDLERTRKLKFQFKSSIVGYRLLKAISDCIYSSLRSQLQRKILKTQLNIFGIASRPS